MNAATAFAFAWALAASLAFVAVYNGNLVPRYCVGSQIASTAQQDYVSTLSQWDRKK
jgi:hypothetical protein